MKQTSRPPSPVPGASALDPSFVPTPRQQQFLYFMLHFPLERDPAARDSPADSLSPLPTVSEVARLIGLSRITIYRWFKDPRFVQWWLSSFRSAVALAAPRFFFLLAQLAGRGQPAAFRTFFQFLLPPLPAHNPALEAELNGDDSPFTMLESNLNPIPSPPPPPPPPPPEPRKLLFYESGRFCSTSVDPISIPSPPQPPPPPSPSHRPQPTTLHPPPASAIPLPPPCGRDAREGVSPHSPLASSPPPPSATPPVTSHRNVTKCNTPRPEIPSPSQICKKV